MLVWQGKQRPAPCAAFERGLKQFVLDTSVKVSANPEAAGKVVGVMVTCMSHSQRPAGPKDMSCTLASGRWEPGGILAAAAGRAQAHEHDVAAAPTASANRN